MHRARHIVVSVILVLLIFIAGLSLFYVGYLHETLVSNIKHDTLLPTPSTGETVPLTPSSAGSQPVEIPLAKGPLNILMIGSDVRTNASSGVIGRSDVIILAHISSDRRKVYLVHFPRDMYVEIPGHGNGKINAAFAYGGSQLLVRTLHGLIDVPIDHVAVIGSKGFEAMTDAVGGVDVYAEEASIDEVYTDDRTEKVLNPIHVGMNHLNGAEALGFVSERVQLSQGDISRGRRQQAFLKALMLKILSRETLTNPLRFVSFVNAIARNLTLDTSFAVSELYADALSLKNLRSDDIVFVTAPITGFGRSPQGASIDVVDKVKMAELSAALRTDTMSAYVAGQ